MNKIEEKPRFRLLSFFIGGLVLLFIFVAITQTGLIGYWVPLDRPTKQVSELITYIGGDLSPHLIVSSIDGSQFKCVSPGAGCHSWFPRTEEMRVAREVGKYSCNLSHPRFTLFSRPFDKVTDCLEILYSAGGYGTLRYVSVLDDLGNLWVGIFNEDLEEIFPLFFLFLPVALLGTFLTALVWNFLPSHRRTGAQETRVARRKAFRGWLWRTLRNAARVGSIPCVLYAFYKLTQVENLLDNPETLLYSLIAVCMLIAWRKPFAGGISGMVGFSIMICWLKLSILFSDYFSAINYIWCTAVLLAFIGSAIFKTPDSEAIETSVP